MVKKKTYINDIDEKKKQLKLRSTDEEETVYTMHTSYNPQHNKIPISHARLTTTPRTIYTSRYKYLTSQLHERKTKHQGQDKLFQHLVSFLYKCRSVPIYQLYNLL